MALPQFGKLISQNTYTDSVVSAWADFAWGFKADPAPSRPEPHACPAPGKLHIYM